MEIERGKKLLLVEDEAIIAMVTARMLQRSGYDVLTVNNGSKAVETALTDISIDLILMDIDLGSGINGPEAARQILQMQSIPIVFLTSHGEQEVVEMVREITRYGYVIKNSGDFVLLSSIEMAFELFASHERLKSAAEYLRVNEERVRSKLESIISPEGDVAELELADIVDIRMLQSIMEDYNSMTEIGVSIIDLNGNILVTTGWKDICRDFHRANPDSCRNCVESDTAFTMGIAAGTYKLYKCKNNMWNMATPVEVGGKHVGNLFLGQFLFDDDVIDYELYRAQASQYGYNEKEYITAIESLPRYGRDTIFTAMTFYIKLLNIISKLSYSNIKLAKTLSERDRYSALHKESETRLSDLADYMVDIVMRLDAEGFFKYISPSCGRVLGYRPEELIGTWAPEIFHPSARDRNISDITRVCSAGEGSVEFRQRHKDGSYRWFEATGRNIYDETGARTGSVLGARDITDRKRGEEVLIEKDERYRRLFESVVGYVYTVFIENKIPVKTVHGPGCEAITGYTPDDFVTDPELWYKMIHPEDRGRVVLFASDIINKGIFTPIEHRIICRDGSMSWVRNTPVPHYSIDNKLIEYDSIIADITESKTAELSLKESREILLNIINSSPDYIFVKDNDLRIALCNEVYATAMNSRPDELIGKTDIECGWGEELVKGDIQKGIRGYENDDLRALAGEKVIVEKEKAVIKGEIRYFDTIKTPLYKNGRITSLLGISRDITERETAAHEKKAIMDLLRIINTSSDMHDLMKTIIIFLKSWSGCEAVGIRLKDGEDYPYFETDGFPEDFIKLENSLCAYDIKGQMLRDDIGNPVIECMCGNIISGRFDPSKSFFTEHGSFWSNCTTDLLRSTTDADRQAHTRNRCNGVGYESVALIPLKTANRTFGLIQLNDKRKGMYTRELINLFEHLGNNIAVALSEMMTREELKESEARYRIIFEKSPELILLLRGGKYIFANPAGAEMLGYKYPDDIYGVALEKTISSEDMVEIRKREQRALKGEANPAIELKFIRQDGSYCLTESASFPIILADGPAVLVIGRDITGQRKLEKEIIAGFEKYRIVADFTYDWEFWIGTDGGMIYCSPSCERVTGYSKNEFMNDSLLLHGIVFPDDLNSPCLSQKEVNEYPETNETEFRIRHKNGSVRWIGHSCRAVYDEAGNFNGRRGSNRDITEQKLLQIETESALGRLDDLWNVAMHADESLQSICDYILSTIVRIAKSRYGFYGFINDDETEMTIFSWSGEAMKDCSMPLKPQKYQISECGVWAEAIRQRDDLIINDYKSDNPAKKGYPAGHLELDNLMVIPVIIDGRIKSVAAVANSETGYNEYDRVNLKIFMTNIQSIIQKKQADEKARESEIKIKVLMNSTTDAAFLMTPDGIVLESNKTHADRFGIDVDQLIGTNAYSYLPPDVAAARKNRIDEVIKTGKPMVFEDVRDGLYLESHVYLIKNDSGDVSSVAIFSRDITERKESFEKINSLLKEKELLLGEVHHRIKNNMNTISGLLSLQAMSMSDSAAVTALNDARSRVQSMMIMYDKLYRSGDYRKMSLKEYLEKFIDEIFVIFENQRQVGIEKDIDDFVLETKLLFPLGIIINELITNCFKYAFPGGRKGVITVSAGRVNDEINISIHDNGVGVPDQVASSKSGGFGLNLVSALTEQIGGTVKISKDNGTKVEIIFPAPLSPG